MTIRTSWNARDLAGDWLLGKPTDPTGALETAIINSLFTDRLAEPDDKLPDNGTDRRGWWGDAGSEAGGRIGSRLWLLSREKQTEETRQRAIEYLREAVQWLIDDGVAERVEVDAQWRAGGLLECVVTAFQASGARRQVVLPLPWREIA